MAIVDKTFQRFDENTKVDRLGLINALIFASNNKKSYKTKLRELSNEELFSKDRFILRLISTLELYKKEGRLTSFGKDYEEGLGHLISAAITSEDLKKMEKKLQSLQTAGGEMGIWVDSEYGLSEMAQEVADSRLTTRNYISIVFLNLFSFFQKEGSQELHYKHILFEILTYFNEKGIKKSYDKSFLVEIFGFYNENDVKKVNSQKNILADYLISTDFFEVEEVENKKYIRLREYWQDRIDKLMNLCNLEYKDSSFDEVRSKLNRINQDTKKEYSRYVSKNKNEYLAIIYEYENNEESIDINAELLGHQVGKNYILFGAPGTGKSYNVKNFIREHGIENYDDKSDHPNVFRTTLHPEFSYHDFVGQVMPVVKEEQITYEFKPNIFTKALKKSFHKQVYNKQPVFLILEEMSRANVASVFGDIFQLLDRDTNGESEYRIDNSLIANEIFAGAKKKIFIPSNFYIIGTVNTSDQNVYVMDTAFKRRFEMEYVSTKIDEKFKYLNDFELTFEDLKIDWFTFVNTLNKYIVAPANVGGLDLPEDKQLGYFFIKFKQFDPHDEYTHDDIIKYNWDQIYGKLIHFLWEDIEKATFTENRLFNNEITSFGILYESLKNNVNIFSEEFTNRLILAINKGSN